MKYRTRLHHAQPEAGPDPHCCYRRCCVLGRRGTISADGQKYLENYILEELGLAEELLEEWVALLSQAGVGLKSCQSQAWCGQ